MTRYQKKPQIKFKPPPTWLTANSEQDKSVELIKPVNDYNQHNYYNYSPSKNDNFSTVKLGFLIVISGVFLVTVFFIGQTFLAKTTVESIHEVIQTRLESEKQVEHERQMALIQAQKEKQLALMQLNQRMNQHTAKVELTPVRSVKECIKKPNLIDNAVVRCYYGLN
jgi:hypothetical protein